MLLSNLVSRMSLEKGEYYMAAYIAWALAFCAIIGQFLASRLWISFDLRGLWIAAAEIAIITILVYAIAGQVMGQTILWSLVFGQIFGYGWRACIILMRPYSFEVAPAPSSYDRPYEPGQLYDQHH